MEETKIILAGFFFFFLVDFVFRKHLNTTLKLSLVISREKVMDSYESNRISHTFDDEEPLFLCYGGSHICCFVGNKFFYQKNEMVWTLLAFV